MRLCTYWTCTSYNHGLAQTIQFIFLGKAQTVSCKSFFTSEYKPNYRDSVDNLALELTAMFEGGLCSFQIVFIHQQVMYLPTMPEDNLLEAMTTIRDAKFYGKLTSYVVIEVKVPLTCKIFIAEKGRVLPVEKLRGTLSCKQWLHGGENRGFSCQNLLLCN